jgi:hypothetical protein
LKQKGLHAVTAISDIYNYNILILKTCSVCLLGAALYKLIFAALKDVLFHCMSVLALFLALVNFDFRQLSQLFAE